MQYKRCNALMHCEFFCELWLHVVYAHNLELPRSKLHDRSQLARRADQTKQLR